MALPAPAGEVSGCRSCVLARKPKASLNVCFGLIVLKNAVAGGVSR
jgi:hypothetical protein